MTRKHNPLVALAALILLVTILVLICTGCSSAAAAGAAAAAAETEKDQLETYKHSDRFTVEWYYHGGRSVPDCYIITDTETGAQYLYVNSHNAAGLTVLQPGEG